MRYVAGSAAALLLIIACGAANAQGGEGGVDAGMEAGVNSVPMQSVDGPYPPPGRTSTTPTRTRWKGRVGRTYCH